MISRIHRYPTLHILVLVVAIAIPAALLAFYILDNARNVPIRDEWGLSALIALDTKRGVFSPAHFFAQHEAHRQTTLRLTTSALTLLTHWNLKIAMLVTLGMAIGVVALLVRLLRQQSPRLALVLALPIAAFILTGRAGSSWLWALVNVYFWLILAVLGGILILYSRVTTRRVIVAALLGSVALFSTLAGLMHWPVMVVVLWLQGSRNWRHYALTIGIGLVIVVLYFSNFRPFTDEANPLNQEIGGMVEFWLGLVGAPMNHDWRYGFVIGVVAVALFVLNLIYLFWRLPHEKATFAPWIGLALFALGTAALTASGRSILALPATVTSRYVLTTSLFWVALVVILAKIATTPLRRKGSYPLALLNGAALIALIPLYIVAAWTGFSQLSYATEVHEQCAYRFPWTDDSTCLAGLAPPFRIRAIMTDLHRLAAYDLALFAGQEISVLPPDTPSGAAVLIVAPNPWQHVPLYIRQDDGTLTPVPDERIFHALTSSPHWLVPVSAPTFMHQAAGESPETRTALANFLHDESTVLVLQTGDAGELSAALLGDFDGLTPVIFDAPEALFTQVALYER